MSDPNSAPPPSSRMSRGIKLVLMGVAGAALLYSCAPGIGGLGGMPYFWFLPNPFFRGPATTTTTTTSPGTHTTSPGTTSTTPGQTQPSTRGGFGGSAGGHESTSSS